MRNPPELNEPVQIYNQATETHRVKDLARLVSEKTGVELQFIENPRNEAPENELVVENSKLRSLGLNPTTLENGLLDEVVNVARRYQDRCDKSKILPRSYW